MLRWVWQALNCIYIFIYRLDHCREDPAVCICIIMQIKSAITEIASVCPKMTILAIITARLVEKVDATLTDR